jgi:hypothetical protein
MTDPKRWLDEEADATFEERELLQSGREVRAPSALRKRVWLGIAAGAAGVGTTAGAAGVGATAAAAGGALPKGVAAKVAFSLLSSSAAKTVMALAVVGAVAAGVVSFRLSPTAIRSATAVRSAPLVTTTVGEAPSDRMAAPQIVEPIAEPGGVPGALSPAARPRAADTTRSGSRPATLAPAAASAAPTPDEDRDSRPSERASESRAPSRLREESAAVLAIRKTLLSGNATEALHMLDRARADFPGGALGQEREALRVRALVESGQKDAARKRGEAFLRAFPRSPYAAEVRSLLGP